MVLELLMKSWFCAVIIKLLGYSLIPCKGLPLFRLQTRQWSENTIRKEKRFRAVRRSSDIRTGLSVREVDVVVTPRVREEVQRHFGCDKVSLNNKIIGSLYRLILFFNH